jgi:hypothetical protein
MGLRQVLMSALKWGALVSAILINTVLVLLIRNEYPRTLLGYHRHHSRKPHPLSKVVRLEGPNMTIIDKQAVNLTNRSICVDYRKFTLHQDNVMEVPHGYPPPLVYSPKPKYTMALKDVLDVEKFVIFVGYPRSGHSIVGSMMDAHPNMIIAHEYNLFRQWVKSPAKHSHRTHLYSVLLKNSMESAMSGWRSERKSIKGYTLGVGTQWQANFTRLRVIGDKSGAVTAQEYEKYPERFLSILEQLKQVTGVPIRVIHVVRNPYDMISTRLLYADGEKKAKLPATEERRHCNDYGLGYHINRTFGIVKSVHALLKRTNLTVLDVHHADLIGNPKRTISMICRFLNLPHPEEYLNVCEKKTYSKHPKTRLLVHWPIKMVEMVHQLSRPYSFLWRYSFEGD